MLKKVVLLKLTNGDEIFGVLSSLNEMGTVLLENPMCSDIVTGDDGKPKMVINRYMPFYKSTTIEINPLTIVCIGEVTETLNEYYQLSLQYTKIISENLDDNVKTTLKNMKSALNDLENLTEEKEIDHDIPIIKMPTGTLH